MTLDEMASTLFDAVLEEGVVIQWVDGDPESLSHRGVPWAYTVGRTMYGQPELLVTGLDEYWATRLLRAYGNTLNLQENMGLPDFRGLTYIDAERGLLIGAYALFGENFKASQVIWAGNGEQPLHPLGATILTDPYPDA